MGTKLGVGVGPVGDGVRDESIAGRWTQSLGIERLSDSGNASHDSSRTFQDAQLTSHPKVSFRAEQPASKDGSERETTVKSQTRQRHHVPLVFRL
jgi:hypothetical protein